MFYKVFYKQPSVDNSFHPEMGVWRFKTNRVIFEKKLPPENNFTGFLSWTSIILINRSVDVIL